MRTHHVAHYACGAEHLMHNLSVPFFATASALSVFDAAARRDAVFATRVARCGAAFPDAFVRSALPPAALVAGARCNASECYYFDVAESSARIARDDAAVLYVEDPLTTLAAAHEAATDRSQPWMRFQDGHPFFDVCASFRPLPPMHWFRPTPAEQRVDLDALVAALDRTTFEPLAEWRRALDRAGVRYRLERVGRPDVGAMDAVLRPLVAYAQNGAAKPNATAVVASARGACGRVSARQRELGFAPIACKDHSARAYALLAAAAVVLLIALHSHRRTSAADAEEQPLKL